LASHPRKVIITDAKAAGCWC